jgi:hypothetical protein
MELRVTSNERLLSLCGAEGEGKGPGSEHGNIIMDMASMSRHFDPSMILADTSINRRDFAYLPLSHLSQR